jgi:O-antigen/teichoic acid export membrane protein
MTTTAVRPETNPSFARSTSHVLAGGVAAQLAVAATLALSARGLGRPVFGLMVTVLGIAAVAQDLLDFGSSTWLSRELASGRLSLGTVRATLRSRLAFVAVVCLASATVAGVVGAALPLVAGVAVYVVGAVGNAGMHGRIRAHGQFRRSAAHTFAERLGWFGVAIVVVSLHPGRVWAAAALVGGMGVSYGISSACAPRISADRSDPVSLLTVYRRSRAFGLLGLSSDLQQLDATAAAGLGGVVVAANVGIASKLTGPVGMVAGAVSLVAFRGVARGGRQARDSARSALRLSAALALAVAAAAPVLPIVAVAVLGSQYGGARNAIIVYAIGTAFAVLNQPLAGVLTAAGHDRVVARIIGSAVVFGLVIGALLVRPAGAVGMAFGFVITQMLILGACSYLYRRNRV